MSYVDNILRISWKGRKIDLVFASVEELKISISRCSVAGRIL